MKFCHQTWSGRLVLFFPQKWKGAGRGQIGEPGITAIVVVAGKSVSGNPHLFVEMIQIQNDLFSIRNSMKT